MPQHRHQLSLQAHCTPQERVLLRVMVALIKPLRHQLNLPPLTEADLVALVRQVLQAPE